MKVLGEKIREMRLERSLKQSDLGNALGVSQKTVSGWERGAKLPDITMLMKIADFFDVHTDYLLGRED